MNDPEEQWQTQDAEPSDEDPRSQSLPTDAARPPDDEACGERHPHQQEKDSLRLHCLVAASITPGAPRTVAMIAASVP